MRICFFIGNMSRDGGTERMTQILSNELVQENEVYVLSVRDNGKKQIFELDSRIHYQSLSNAKYIKILSPIKNIFHLISYLKKNKINVLINVDTALALYSLPAVLLCPNIKNIYWEHFSTLSDSGNSKMNCYRKLVLKYGDAFVTLTKDDANELAEKNKVRCHLTNIPNIVPFELYRGEYNAESKSIVTIGHLLSIKGQDLAIEAACIVIKRHPDWKWLFYGDGPEKEFLLDKVRALGLEENVRFMGTTNLIEEVYKNASMCVLPSRSEGFGLVLVEAQAFKLPTIAFDVPYGPRQIIDDEKNGFLVEPFDICKIADGICRLIENKDLRISFSNHAQDNLNRFSKESVVNEWRKLIREITR